MHGSAVVATPTVADSQNPNTCSSLAERPKTERYGLHGLSQNAYANLSSRTMPPTSPKASHRCTYDDCPRETGFKSAHDLHRHLITIHGGHGPRNVWVGYQCMADTCTTTKLWPRLDNLRQHITKLHPQEDMDTLITTSV